jgi:DNA-binding response OmpR family regulator
MATNPPIRFGILISRDLFFGSKVTGTAGQLGLRVELVDTVERATARAADEGCGLILFDLESPQASIRDLMRALDAKSRPPVVAFGAHVHTQWLDEARDAGCDDVMPRSKFTATLPDLLRRYLTG